MTWELAWDIYKYSVYMAVFCTLTGHIVYNDYDGKIEQKTSEEPPAIIICFIPLINSFWAIYTASLLFWYLVWKSFTRRVVICSCSFLGLFIYIINNLEKML